MRFHIGKEPLHPLGRHYGRKQIVFPSHLPVRRHPCKLAQQRAPDQRGILVAPHRQPRSRRSGADAPDHLRPPHRPRVKPTGEILPPKFRLPPDRRNERRRVAQPQKDLDPVTGKQKRQRRRLCPRTAVKHAILEHPRGQAKERRIAQHKPPHILPVRDLVQQRLARSVRHDTSARRIDQPKYRLAKHLAILPRPRNADPLAAQRIGIAQQRAQQPVPVRAIGPDMIDDLHHPRPDPYFCTPGRAPNGRLRQFCGRKPSPARLDRQTALR